MNESAVIEDLESCLEASQNEIIRQHDYIIKLEFQLAEKQKENEKLRKQIEAMKCCGNCAIYNPEIATVECYIGREKGDAIFCYKRNYCNWQPQKEAV